MPRAKNWKNWLGISPTAHLDYFFGLNTPSQCSIDHLVDFWKIFAASEKLKKLTQHIANRPPQLFLWPKYTFPVHYWSSGRLLKNLFGYQKIEKFTSYIASRWPQFFGLYTSFKCIIYRLVDFWKICTVSKILKKFASYNAICLLWFTSAGKSLFLY